MLLTTYTLLKYPLNWFVLLTQYLRRMFEIKYTCWYMMSDLIKDLISSSILQNLVSSIRNNFIIIFLKRIL